MQATFSKSRVEAFSDGIFTNYLATSGIGKGVLINNSGIRKMDFSRTALFNKMGERSWDGIPNAAHGARIAVHCAVRPDPELLGRKIHNEKCKVQINTHCTLHFA